MKVLILGGTGGSGQACARQYLSLGHEVTVLGRDAKKLLDFKKRWNQQPKLSTVVADVYDAASLAVPFAEADLVIQAANPGYVKMATALPKMIEAILGAAETAARKIVFLEGVYTYGANPGFPVPEDFPPAPNSRKGRIKEACAQRILSPSWKRLSAMIVRLPDYYGPTSQMAFLDPTLQALAARKVGIFLGKLQPRREYIYLPDAAERIATLSFDEAAYGQIWNLAGLRLSGKQILDLCRDYLGYKSPILPLGRRSIALLGRFDPFFRELSEMSYLLEDPLYLDDGKYAKRFGNTRNTDPMAAFATTLEAIRGRFAESAQS